MGGKSSKQEAQVLSNNISTAAAAQQRDHLGKPKGPSQAPVLASPAKTSSKVERMNQPQSQLNRDDS